MFLPVCESSASSSMSLFLTQTGINFRNGKLESYLPDLEPKYQFWNFCLFLNRQMHKLKVSQCVI